MQIVNMSDDYRIMCGEIKTFDTFEAYRRYTQKYPNLFDGILKNLYLTELDNLRSMIEAVDFAQLLEMAAANQHNGSIDAITSLAKESADCLGFEQPFTVYLGLEMGNIGGCSCDPATAPFIYIGIDRLLDEKTLSFLVPHEINHMVRGAWLPSIDMMDFCERTITEGLGTYFPLVFHGLEANPTNLSSTLHLSCRQLERLMENSDSLEAEVTALFGQPLTPADMQKYFIYSDPNQEIVLSGYYIGNLIIQRLVNAGADIAKLTAKPAAEIWKDYQSI
ncbi:MAG: DUF2268 domain-containing putative Zn-dependent protease [Anaerolineaceae bacterium]